uniref:G-protein coupled receptors family 1 profile domain-containing protein n=1 Tax=Terrapene triunguis TaxID=2587831 RepID=A0A674JKV9_9SAUR
VSTLVFPTDSNKTDFTNPSTFILVGIPGLEAAHVWISIPFCTMYTIAVLGNFIILFIMKTEPSLHVPMYYFLCMLAITDLVLSTSTLPKMLGIYWFNSKEINFSACLTQMHFIHCFSVMESGIFVAMAFDRYVAICHPLRHSTILTNHVVAKIGLALVLRGMMVILPFPFLASHWPYCRTNIIPHSYCEHMAVVNLASVVKISCGDTTVNRTYSLVVAFVVSGLDLTVVALSYSLIIKAVLRISSKKAYEKALNTCTAHLCVMLTSFTLFFFSALTHRFGQHITLHVHIILANLFFLIPPILNPIIYGVKIKELRDKVQGGFGLGLV